MDLRVFGSVHWIYLAITLPLTVIGLWSAKKFAKSEKSQAIVLKSAAAMLLIWILINRLSQVYRYDTVRWEQIIPDSFCGMTSLVIPNSSSIPMFKHATRLVKEYREKYPKASVALKPVQNWLKEGDIILITTTTPGLDVKSVEETIQDIRKLKDQGKGVLLITHEIDVALKTADRIAIFYSGYVIEINKVESCSGSEPRRAVSSLCF